MTDKSCMGNMSISYKKTALCVKEESSDGTGFFRSVSFIMTKRDLFILGVPVYIDKPNDLMTRVYNTSNLLYYTCEEAAKAKLKAYSNINNGLKIGIGFESSKKNTLTLFRFKRKEIGKKDTLIIPRIVIINARGILKNSAHRLTQYENLITMFDDIALIMITDLHQ
ncbi:uncharacterized protein EV154DRAFT_487765 [Mucor mucedo]|uniref:uncharacterized protein n=1 Tax=Mucor mucedo TaxID=29922 RepID=UPI00221F5097|nr:uncharacterized protein EV154DRAFT_487765 [Mucor mucedo]KAI7870706.1 hypothetical protein EV154DRAFT_487765 [Mucor mucedo]